MEYNYFIYKTTNQINGKIYVGQKKSKGLSKSYLGSGVYFKNALKKYGKSNFKREILEFCTKENLNSREIYWIEKLNATNSEIGYNISTGGGGGNGLFGDKNGMYGKTGDKNPFHDKKHSEETKAVIRENNSSREHVTCPHCKKTMNIGNAKQYHFDNCLYNPNISEEALLSWDKRKGLLEKSRQIKVQCPYCDKIGSPSNMNRYHFENCEKAPVLSKETINRLQKRELNYERKKEKKRSEVVLKKCPHCGFEAYSDNPNIAKHHFDNCKQNPNYKPTYYTCPHCDIKSTNKTNIVRFHGDNCRNKVGNIKYAIQISDDENPANIGIVLKIGRNHDKRNLIVIDGYCDTIHKDKIRYINKQQFESIEPRNNFVTNHTNK